MHTHNRLYKVIAHVLIGVMWVQPLFTIAAELRVDTNAAGNTQITQAGNGVPVVNIATANSNGLSHNKFTDYNVAQQGLILNNSTRKLTQTQLGGIILGNSQLNGKSAQLILNEVTGGQVSQLKGYTEVAGQQAHVVLANPHGITCDGCGFINTPQATLTTGKPVVEQGQLKHYDVDGGHIEIIGAGLNASNISQFDLITRSAKINAELHANQLNIITGRNSVDAHTLAVTAKTERPSDKPNLAIDSSALGGMYAGAIRLVGTEAGVGVKLAGDMAASAGDIQVDARGKLILARVSAQQQIKAEAQDIELTEQVYAGDTVKVNADRLTNTNNLLAANFIDLTVNKIDNQGLIEAGLRADNTLNSTADVHIKSTELSNTGTVIASRHLQLDAKEKIANTAGRLVADTGLTVTTKQLDNQQGLITATGTVEVSAQQLNNTSGAVDSQGQLNIAAQSIDNSSGHIVGDAGVRIDGKRLDNQAGGLLLSHGQLEAAVAALNNQHGSLVADAGVSLKGETLNNAAGRISSQNTVQLDHTELINSQGLIAAGNDLTVAAQTVENAQGELSAGQSLVLDAELLQQKQGQILSAGTMSLSAQTLDNSGQGLISAATELTIQADELNNQEQGTVLSDAVLNIQAKQLNNSAKGLLASKGQLQVQTSQLDQHNRGELISETAIQLNLSGGDLNNSQGGLIYAPHLQLQQVGRLNNSQGGEVSTPSDLELNAAQLNNAGGLVSSGQALQLGVEGMIDNTLQGLLSADQGLQINAQSLDNSQQGTLIAKGELSLQINQQINNSLDGAILAGGQLLLNSATLNNAQQGLISSQQGLKVQSTAVDNSQGGEISSQESSVLNVAEINNQDGQLISEGTLELTQTAETLNNRGGLIHAADALRLNNLRNLDNSQAGEISSKQSLQLTLENLNNSQGGVVVSNEQLKVAAQHIDNQQKGLLSGLTALQVTAGSLDNQNIGTLSSRTGGLSVEVAGQLNNSQQGALVSQQTLKLQAGSLVNQQGIISSQADIELQVNADFDNRSGDIAGQNISLSADNLDNTAGQISAEDTLAITLVNQLLNRHNASLVSGKELLLTASSLDNQNSTIASEGLVSIFAQQLRNEQQATIAANDQLYINAQQLNNHSQGRIYSQNKGVNIAADALSNNSGLIQADDTLDLDITQQLTNQSGRIISEQGAVSVQAHSVDNRDGIIASLLDRLRLSVRSLFSNQSGIAQGQAVTVQANEIDNQAGHLAATATDLELSAAAINNQGGGLYAQQQLKVFGRDLDNSSQGQIAANSVDFSLSAALNNQTGLIEAQRLHILADSINNNQGRLRALAAAGNSILRTDTVLDNRSGSIEVANTGFALDTPDLLNQSGSIIHAGRGQFDLMSGQARNVGGTLISQGELTVTSDSWENSTLFQAGTLTFNVDHFTQSAAGQLIASQSLNATGHTWINEGLIASDGSLNLNLTDSYSGNGQVVSLADMQLSAQQFTLGEPAVFYTEGAGRIDSQQINNQGYISAADGLLIDTQRLHNHGTLGSAQQLTINTPHLSNQHGLLFSGADMLLRVNQFTNRYADVYSLGSIDLTGYGNNAQAQRVDNISASMEAEGDFSLRSALVENRRDVLEVEESGKYSVNIEELPCRGAYNPRGDCKLGSNGRKVGVWQINEREKLEVTASSAAASMQAGGNFSLLGGTLLNASSQISSGGDLTLSLTELVNRGVKPIDIEVQRIFVSGRKPDYYYYLRLKNNFNAKHVPEVQSNSIEEDLSYFIGRMEREYLPGRQTVETPLAGEEYSAIIQAVGNVTISAEQTLENSVIRPSYNYVSGGSRVETRTPGSDYATQVNINSQLPPDLQHKQVDPTVLPGFNLPTGDKGLFRLSDQAVQDVAAQGVEGVQTALGSGSVRGDQLAQQGLQSTGQAVLLGSQLDDLSPAQGLYEKSQVQFVLANVQDLQGQNTSHHYLIETNPALTNMRQFLSSDYLFNGLGLQSDQMQKRLGDGLYEQRLLRESIVARTGQRFIAGLTSDEAMFRYLMDNAIASKDALSLSVGISLSAEQVAALTHDIVWMEEREVLGEKVLTPVLYLAQAEGRLAPSGALIQGGDLTLVSGGDLNNQGTLRASNNLSAQAQNINNSGLIHAGERLSLLAEDSIYNRQGGILAGRDVDLTARSGDILNQRTVTRHVSALGNSRWESSFADSAARIEATRDLTLNAGRDVHNLGGVLESRGNSHISAGRDVTLAAMEERHSTSRGNHYLNSQTTQLSSETRADGNLSIQAGRDLTAIASRVQSGQDMQLIADNDLTLVSAANESHHYSKSKKATNQRDQVRQVGTEVNSGGKFTAVAGQDLSLVSSSVAANDEAYLVAGGKVQLLAAQDYDYSFSEKKKKKSFGRKSYRMNESSSSMAIESLVSAGNNLSIYSGSNLLSEGARLHSGEHLTLLAAMDIQLLAAQDSQSQAQAKSKRGLLSSKAKTNNQSQTSVVGSEVTGREISVVAGRDLLLSGANMRSEADTNLQAGRDIDLTTVEQHSSQSSSKQSSRISFSHHGLLTHNQKKQSAEQGNVESVGSFISAESLAVKSGRDTRIQGSTLIAEHDMDITAERDLHISSAENTRHYITSSSSKKTGGIGNWWQPAVGQVKLKRQAQGEATQQSASQLASLTGNIKLKAGEHYQQTASQVLAIEGDVDIQAQQVTIEAGYDQLEHSKKQSASRTAIGGAVSVPVVDAVQGMQQVGRAVSRTDDSRMQALGAVTLAMQGKTAYDGAKALINKDPAGIKFSVSLGSGKSKSQSAQQSKNVVASSVVAGSDIRIQASGRNDSDVQIVGSIVNAGRDLNVQAGRNILMIAAENISEQNSKNSGSGWSAGIGLGIGGSQSGFTLDLAANQFRGKSNGSDSLWSNTQLEAGRQVSLKSGQDTVLKGAVIKGEQVTAQVGGDLILESLQDTSTYTSKSSSSSVGASLCIPPFCAGASTVSGSYNNSKVLGDYASVSEQTGIQAGDGGFQLKVNGRTDLTGAVIASSEQAVQDGLNRLESGTLVVRDIENHSDYKASSSGLVAGIGFGVGEANKEAMAQANQDKSYRPDLTGSAVSTISGRDSAVTHSGISHADIVITDWQAQQELTGQTATALLDKLNDAVRSGDGAGGIDKNWDGKKLERVVQANTEIMTAFSQQAGHAVSAYVQNKREELLEQKRNADNTATQEEIQGQINALNTQERVMNVVIGALTGQLDTAVAHAVLQEAADQMRQYSIESSSRFAGVIVGEDEHGNPLVLSNISGDSAGVRGDGIKLGGVRVDLDLICGANNQRCATLRDENNQEILDSRGVPVLKLENGMVKYDEAKAEMSFEDFKLTKDGQKMSGLTGGVQGFEGTMAGKPYAPNSFWDHMVESFAGTHDTIGGGVTGLYDEQGNTTRGLSDAQSTLYNTWSAIAIAPSAPFAISEALPSEAWQVLEILLKGGRQ